MNVVWLYLDKKAAAEKALKDFRTMQFILDHTYADIDRVYSWMEGIGSPLIGKMPSAHNPQAGEDRMVNGIGEIDALRERQRQAQEYMNWILPAWNALDEDERFVLDCFYSGNQYGTRPAEMVADHFCIEPSSAHRKKARALDHLTALLYGRW